MKWALTIAGVTLELVGLGITAMDLARTERSLSGTHVLGRTWSAVKRKLHLSRPETHSGAVSVSAAGTIEVAGHLTVRKVRHFGPGETSDARWSKVLGWINDLDDHYGNLVEKARSDFAAMEAASTAGQRKALEELRDEVSADAERAAEREGQRVRLQWRGLPIIAVGLVLSGVANLVK
ncbi:MAG TPA: hypothetical protein VFB41_07050 [Solirubrobacteraceae bacterium]|nr:hypothetical protein [Solirubrobacteraceae bacterium]